jgi:hypothetical protein
VVDATPTVKFWRPADVNNSWPPPACTRWNNPRFNAIVTTVGRFRYSGPADGLMRRVGAVSSLEGVRYWSETTGKWKTFILRAHAVTAPKDRRMRSDFSPDEIRRGDTVFYEQTDNLAGRVLYRMRVLESSPTRIVIAAENAEPLKYLWFSLAAAGGVQSIYFFDRDSPGVWRFYGIMRIGDHTSRLLTRAPASFMNRAVAFYRHYAGIPTDQEPPIVRQ